MLRLTVLALALTACTPVWAEPEKDAKPPRLDLQRPIEGARLTVQRVQLSTPMELRAPDASVVQVAEVVEFRVETPDQIPARAADPVLHVGDRTITEYRYEGEGNVLVFTTTELPAPDPGAEIYLQFGDQEATRTPLPEFRPEDVERVKR